VRAGSRFVIEAQEIRVKAKGLLKAAAAAAALVGATLSMSAPARAEIGIGFSYDSGGYCDADGCPDGFWDDPVSYCPVYFDGEWYRGPMYYREDEGGDVLYWIHGAWREDAWDDDDFGPRPGWACENQYGPPLDIDFYLNNGFHWRREWRDRFHHDHDGHPPRPWHDPHGGGGHGRDRGPNGDTGDHRGNWDRTQHDGSDHHGRGPLDWDRGSNNPVNNNAGSNNTPPPNGSDHGGRHDDNGGDHHGVSGSHGNGPSNGGNANAPLGGAANNAAGSGSHGSAGGSPSGGASGGHSASGGSSGGSSSSGGGSHESSGAPSGGSSGGSHDSGGSSSGSGGGSHDTGGSAPTHTR
jgi:hypothetical protein